LQVGTAAAGMIARMTEDPVRPTAMPIAAADMPSNAERRLGGFSGD